MSAQIFDFTEEQNKRLPEDLRKILEDIGAMDTSHIVEKGFRDMDEDK